MKKSTKPPVPKSRQCSEIPTAIMEPNLFLDDENNTFIEDPTLELTPMTDTHEGTPTPNLEKFRRPTPSEIRDAVDQVNTEAVDLAAVAQAQAQQDETNDV